MDQLRLELTLAKFGSRQTSNVNILINETSLADLARVVELPHARAERNPKLAGDYSPMIIEEFRDKNGLLGDPACSWFEDGDTVLMGCPCGEWGCWPLTVRIDVDPDRVTWRDFRNGHRDWDLQALGPFVFDRSEYEAAISVLG
jgi:hypothetical protein